MADLIREIRGLLREIRREYSALEPWPAGVAGSPAPYPVTMMAAPRQGKAAIEDETAAKGVLGTYLDHPSKNYKRCLAGLRQVYPRRGSIEKLITEKPRQAWQVRCWFLKTCAAGDPVGINAPEICRGLIGTTDLLTCLPLIERLTTIDMVATPPEHTDSVFIPFAGGLDRRAGIRPPPMAQ
jgi:hypothetical protein